jgi:hypothetical protein
MYDRVMFITLIWLQFYYLRLFMYMIIYPPSKPIHEMIYIYEISQFLQLYGFPKVLNYLVNIRQL